MKSGMLPLCQEALTLGDISYHDYQGIVINSEEKKQLVKNLGPTNKVNLYLRLVPLILINKRV